MKTVYLAMAVVGAVVPYAFFVQHIAVQGADPVALVSAVTASPAVSGFTADLVLASVAFWAAMFHERRRGGPNPILFIALNLLIGLSCAIPAHLYARTRRADAELPVG
jgi:MFS-type transporter involved in bile tolerance (Atg22 family)